MVTAGKVYTLGAEGNLFCLDVEKGKVLWSHPAFANRHLYARNNKEIICVDLAVKNWIFASPLRARTTHSDPVAGAIGHRRFGAPVGCQDLPRVTSEPVVIEGRPAGIALSLMRTISLGHQSRIRGPQVPAPRDTMTVIPSTW